MKTTKHLLNTSSFDYVNENIVKLFKPEPIRGEVEVRNFGKYMTSEQVIAELTKDGCVPANATELFSWFESNKDWGDGKYQSVVALGSVADFGGERHVPCVWWGHAERGADLDWFGSGWDDGDWFAFVRESPQNSDTKTSALEPLNLEQHINSDTLAALILVANEADKSMDRVPQPAGMSQALVKVFEFIRKAQADIK